MFDTIVMTPSMNGVTPIDGWKMSPKSRDTTGSCDSSMPNQMFDS